MAAVDLEGTADWSEGRIFTVEALSAFAAASGGLTREADASDIRDSDSERSAALSPLSLEQIISSNLVPEIWTVLVKESSKAVESQGEDIAFMELQGVSYVWRTDQFLDWGLPDTKQIGLIAQNVEAVIPELVITESKGYKAVSYGKLTAVLVEAIKELKAENKTLKMENEKLKAKLDTEIDHQQSQIDEIRALVERFSG